MANRERGEVSVEVEGKAYTLRPTFDAICELETRSGKGIEDLLADIESGRLSGLRLAIWCLLQDQHSDEIRELKDASQWIERAGGVDVIFAHLAQMRDLNTAPASGKRGTGNPRKAQAGTGRRSLRALDKSA
jgi:hypothetical protein